MPTIKINSSKDCNASLRYVKGKNKLSTNTKNWLKRNGVNSQLVNNLKNRAVVQSGYNLINNDHAIQEMSQTKNLYKNFKPKTNEAVQFIQSFSKSELSATNPKDWNKAAEIGTELAKKISPDREFYIGVHLDNKHHLVHNHIIMNSIDLNNGKRYHKSHPFNQVSIFSDKIARKHGMKPIPRITYISKRTQKHYRIRRISEPRKRSLTERQLRAQGHYVWKDDLRNRIDSVKRNNSVHNLGEFQNHLKQLGVKFNNRKSSSSYHFKDRLGKERKIRGYRLGALYTKDNVKEEITSGRRLQRNPTRNASHGQKSINRLRASADKSTKGRKGQQLRFERVSRPTKQYYSSAKRYYKTARQYYPFQGNGYRGLERSVHQRISKVSEQSEDNEGEIQETNNIIETEELILKRISAELSENNKRSQEIVAKLQAQYARLEIRRQEQDEQRRRRNERRQSGPKGPSMG